MSPFKHPKITYGLPTDPYNNEIVNEYIDDITTALGLQRKPVGVKFFFDEEEFNNIDIPKFEGKICYCCMVEKATRGMQCKTTLENHLCDGGSTSLGLEASTERIESGMEYFSYNLYATPAAARRVREGVPGLYRTGVKTHGVLVQPLSKYDITPDVVICIVNPYQAMRILQGYVYHTGGRTTMTGAAMQGICAEATVEPYLSGKINMTPLCPSTRLMAKWKDEEMAIGIPFEHFKDTVKGIMATINGTDIAARKKQILEKFQEKGKKLELETKEYEF